MKQKLIKNIGALVILIFALGCATGGGKQGAVQGAQNPVLTALDVTDNKLNIVVDKPFTYTIYKSSDPYKVIVELPDVRMGFAPTKIKSDKAGITEITPSQTEDPVSTKLEILLSSPVTVEPVYKDTTLVLKVKEEPEAKGAEITSEAPKAEEKVQEVSAPAGKVEEPVKWAEVAQPQPEQKAIPAAESKEEPAVAGAEQKAIIAAAVKENNKTAKPEQKAAVARDLPPATSILQVKIEKGQDVLKVVIKGNGSLNPNVFRLDNRAVLDIPNVQMAAALPSNVLSPLKGIRANSYKDKTRIVLDMKEGTSFDVAAIEDSVIISFRLPEERYAAKAAVGETKVAAVEAKAAVETQEKPGESRYKGQKISLDFQDADIGPIFRLLADISGYNFIIDPSVKGRITMKLMNVPWDQALDIILQTFSFGKSVEGNIIWIAPSSLFTKIDSEKTAEKVRLEKQEDLAQEIVRINYADAGAISGAITSGKLLSSRGNITMDNRMNTLIIKDTQKSIDKIKELVKIMDVAKSQVMIEAKIVTASTSYTSSLGIRWGGQFVGSPGFAFTTDAAPGSIQSATATGAGGIKGLGNDVSSVVSVNTPLSSTSGPGGVLSMLIGSANSTRIALSLQALETIKKAKTLSNPRILTMDNEAATITQGVTFYTTSTSAEGTKTEAQNAALSLNVTPKITPDGYIQLKVTVSDDSLASVTPPVKNTKTLTTQALVKDGETLVLGGIYTDSEVNDETGIPLLSKIPILGWLFKTKQDVGPGPTEMLIFITPRVVSKPI
ncbi:MAG: type IV pilus secretin PilQ [Thermodesulfovibrionales bacterium]|nr:type IV pilus secretin PilQ [Thermodesulfovibrionales bacterium]